MKKILLGISMFALLFFIGTLSGCGEKECSHQEETIVGKAATCEETGLTDGKKCALCGEILVEQKEIAALGHTEVVDAAVAPSCTETGLSEGKHCSVCNKTIVAQEEVSALGHTEEVVEGKAATCTETGLTDGKKCSVCGETTVAQEEIAVLGHAEETVDAKAATCTEAGNVAYTHCSVCNKNFDAEGNELENVVIEALGHKFIDGKCTCGEEYVAPVSGWTLVTELNDGDKVLIGAPAYGKLLSAEKVNATSYYNKGVNYSTDNFENVTDAEIFVVTANEDGTYTFTSLTGKVIAMAASYNSLNDTGVNKSWALEEKGEGLFYLKNTARNLYLEWYASKNNWSTHGPASSDLFELSFYAQVESTDTEHVHNHISDVHNVTCTEDGYTTYTCSCGDTYTVEGEKAQGHQYSSVVTAPTCTEAGYTTFTCTCGDSYKEEGDAATGHNYVDGKCACGEIDPETETPETPVTTGSADFNTITTSNANGDSGYKNTYTTANGWVTNYSAIQSGGATVLNPQYPVIGPDNSYKAVCLTGHTSNPGKITSPTLNGGLSKLVINFTKIFTDTELSVTVTVTELSSGNTYTHVIAKTLPKDEKYQVYTDEWILETPVTGDFTIEIVNNCPTQQAGNKDRMTILSIDWVGAANVHTHEYESSTTATCTAAGVTTYTCSCGDTYTEDTEALGHVDANLDIDCDREGCTGKVAPKADSTLSLTTANHLGSKLSTSGSYYVEGTIVEVLDAKNGIFYLGDETGEKFYFRLPKNAEGVSHANWTVKLVLGDKVRVYGKINKFTSSSAPNGQYYPAIQGGVVTLLEQHPHVFGEPTCVNPGYCACGQDGPVALGHNDGDGDDLCDRCQFDVTLTVEGVEVRTDNNSGVTDDAKTSTTWSGTNFDVIVAKGTSTQLYSTAKDHMRIYKGNTLKISNKTGITIKSIILHVTNETQLTYIEAMLAGKTYTKNVEELTITVEWNSAENLVLTNNGSTLQLKEVEITYKTA